LMQRLTAPFFKQRHPLLKPIWKRRHQDHFNNPE
jgi:hypothetical protein